MAVTAVPAAGAEVAAIAQISAILWLSGKDGDGRSSRWSHHQQQLHGAHFLSEFGQRLLVTIWFYCVSGFATSVVNCSTTRVPMGLPM
jgi:hypothetical protein